MAELVVEPWTNEFGQTINPGEEIIFAGTSWKQTRIRKGVFGGVHYGLVYKSREVVNADGNVVKHDNGYPKRESYTERDIVSVRVEKVNRGFKYVSGRDENGKYFHNKTDEIDYGVSTLPLKRVYKLNTSMAEMAGQYF